MPRNIHGKQNWEESDLKDMVMVQEHYYVGKGSHLRIFFFFGGKKHYQSYILLQLQLHEDSKTLYIREGNKESEREKNVSFKSVKQKWWHCSTNSEVRKSRKMSKILDMLSSIKSSSIISIRFDHPQTRWPNQKLCSQFCGLVGLFLCFFCCTRSPSYI